MRVFEYEKITFLQTSFIKSIITLSFGKHSIFFKNIQIFSVTKHKLILFGLLIIDGSNINDRLSLPPP